MKNCFKALIIFVVEERAQLGALRSVTLVLAHSQCKKRLQTHANNYLKKCTQPCEQSDLVCVAAPCVLGRPVCRLCSTRNSAIFAKSLRRVWPEDRNHRQIGGGRRSELPGALANPPTGKCQTHTGKLQT